ncbi:hypothetical protein K3729_10130 [Rhodobacteraceae bacterium S2214]|nr:hypothetical protein K3729_10130 [Rhodobacteraceae bacterium S2214]
MKSSQDIRLKRHRVAGVVVHGPRPTKLAAALVATAVSIPFVIVVSVMDLLT